MELMRQGDHPFFKKFYRISPATFDKQHELLQADLQRMHCIRVNGNGSSEADSLFS
ncbi:hypothetical protein HPB47_015401 [Ixodes persulcatus]|uniref:Uncharacterized protein n=1 Tax=Ixodes persulcatus TaxID=34615 RepID=A0AC60QTQ9_IXOPE|nr:hypothetical protein HPB47_015401 [Ixodes persulcatus]